MEKIAAYFSNYSSQYFQSVLEHLEISLLSVLIAILIAVPLGIISTHNKFLQKLTQRFFGMLRIIPSLTILVIAIPLLGTGVKPAVLALAILAIPPILVNTMIGFQTLPASVLETAKGMGMSRRQTFFKVKFPLAFPVIFTGIRIAVVEVIASATLAAYIGAGGLGGIIITGLGLMKTEILFIGGVSVAILSLLCGEILNRIGNYITRYQRIDS